MSNDYTKLDVALINAIGFGHCRFTQLDTRKHNDLAKEAAPSARESWRVIDSRLQAMRRAGVIAFDRKTGWRIVEQSK